MGKGGNLSSPKVTFCSLCCPSANVKSPSFALVNEYRGETDVFHFDVWRITDEDDLYSIGYDDYCEATGYIIVEWSENISDSIPKDAAFVTIERLPEDEQSRKITVKSNLISKDARINDYNGF